VTAVRVVETAVVSVVVNVVGTVVVTVVVTVVAIKSAVRDVCSFSSERQAWTAEWGKGRVLNTQSRPTEAEW
jgi:hypothetical protein